MADMTYLLLISGFIFLVKGADIFVDGSAALAQKFSIPPLIIGLTIVSFGTSAPELAVSLSASLKGANNMAIGNVIGSNLFNLLAVLGISALFYPLYIQHDSLTKDFHYVTLISFVLLILTMDHLFQNGEIDFLSRSDGLVLLSFFGIFMYYLIRSALHSRAHTIDEPKIPTISLGKSVVYCVLGITGIIIGGEFVVNSASKIAIQFGMSESLVGLTIIAIGTSLPELVTSIAAALKKENDIAVGNVLGSNLFNILMILGLSATISPMTISSTIFPDLLFMLLITLFVFIYCLIFKNIGRILGGVLTICYIVYTILIIIRN